MSNYPPGVSGNEWQIAGPSKEWDEEREVEHACDEDRFEENFEGKALVRVTQWDFYSRSIEWVCPQCGEDVEDEDDPEDYAPEPYED